MRWGVFCSALALATMVATAGVPDGKMQSGAGEHAWKSIASSLPTPLARPVRPTEVRPRVAGSAAMLGLMSDLAALARPRAGSEAEFTMLALPFCAQGLCQAQTSRGPPVA